MIRYELVRDESGTNLIEDIDGEYIRFEDHVAAVNRLAKRPEVTPTALPWSPEETARRFHTAYEVFAPAFGWVTQERSRVTWEQLPENQRALMIAVVRNVLIEQAQPQERQE